MKFSDTLITQFRDEINSNSNFVYEQYHNVNGKNYWNVICSCMDWITLAIRYISSDLEYSKDIDVKVMQVYTYISAVDIIFEAVNQLYRIIFNKKETLFKGNSHIFQYNSFHLSDNDYFKEIRSIFGAHPVNLSRDNQRKYASWPYNPFSNQNAFLEVSLYSNEVGIKDQKISLDFNQLNLFLKERYEYLEQLSDEIQRQYSVFVEKLAKKKIPDGKNVIETLEILQKESKNRLNNDYYNSCISDLLKLFSVTLKDKNLKDEEISYKNELQKVVSEIKNNLQKMNLVDLITDEICSPPYPFDKLGYELTHLYPLLYDWHYDPLFTYYLNALNDYSNNRYNFSSDESHDVIFLKLRMMLHSLNKRQLTKSST